MKNASRFVQQFSLLLPALVFLLCGCKKIDTVPPPPTSLHADLKAPVSELVFPISFRVSELQSVLNDKIQGKFISAWLQINKREDSLMIEVTKSAPIRLRWEVPFMRIDIPLHVEAQIRTNFQGINLQNKHLIKTDLVLHLQSEVHFSKDWELQLRTHLDSINWENDPKLKVLFLHVDLRKRIEKLLLEKQKFLTRRMDEQIGRQLHLRKAISKLWRDIQKPIRINKKQVNVWLQNRCESIRWQWVEAGDSLISVQLQATSFPVISVGSKGTNKINRTLPACTMSHLSSSHNSLHLFVYSKLPYKVLNNLLNQNVQRFKLEQYGHTLKVRHIEVYGIDSNGLAIKINVHGSLRGDIYARGFPYYDSVTHALKIRHFSFDIGTENALVNGADWVFHSTLLETLQEKMVIPIDTLIHRVPALMVKGIEKSKVGSKIEVTLPQFEARLHSLMTTRDNLQLILRADAKASMLLEKKVFMKKRKKLRIYRPKAGSEHRN